MTETEETRRRPPRKVAVGTMCHAMYGTFTTLEARVEELIALLDDLAARSRRQLGRELDLAVLPEFALTDMRRGLPERALPVDHPVWETFERKARRMNCYLVVPAVVRDGDVMANSAVLLDRAGQRVGRYDKVHLCPDEPPEETFEGGLTPGRRYPVFDCDFGRIGLQLCFDYAHDEGWCELARRGAELVAWPTQSPSVILAGARAVLHHTYIVSSTWRDNATLLDPGGAVAAQVRPPEELLVAEIDLEWRLLAWHPRLRNGETLRERYGRKVGFRWYAAEDYGLFWSNDPAVPIGQMVHWLGTWTHQQYVDVCQQRLEHLRRNVPLVE